MATSENSETLVNEINHTENIVIKGYRSGLILIIPEDGPFESYLKEVEAHLKKAHHFFEGAKISLQLGKRKLLAAEYEMLLHLFNENGLVLQNNSELVKPVSRNTQQKTPVQKENVIPTITIKKTLRSGQKIEFEGNVLIMGDINPGAEVIATGDVVVMGKLRGTVHAGAGGDQSSQIVAFQINPVQIRIAGLFARGSDKTRRSKDIRPEVARIKENRIVVEKFIS